MHCQVFVELNLIGLIYANTPAHASVLPPNITRDQVFKFLGHSAGFIDNVNFQLDELQRMDEVLAINNMTVNGIAEYLHQPCSELLVRCRWEYEMVPCMEIFEATMSYHGGCCTFRKFE